VFCLCKLYTRSYELSNLQSGALEVGAGQEGHGRGETASTLLLDANNDKQACLTCSQS